MSDMRTIPGFPSYSITKDGRVRGIPRKRTKGEWLKPGVSRRDGHLSVVLCEYGKRKTRTIHQLVLETYVGPRPDGMGCRHLDGNPANNRLDNLCWGTQGENMQDAAQHGTIGSTKLVVGDVRAIVHLYSIGAFSQTRLAELYGVCQSTINNVLLRKTWRCVWAVT